MERRNPYNYRSPIEEAEHFFGREEQLVTSREFIAKKACLSFVGERRCGLTSLLNRLICPDFQHACAVETFPLQFIHIDCKQFDEPLPLVRYLLAEIEPHRSVPEIPRWRSLYSRLVRSVRAKVERLVILFDDFEQMGSNERFVSFIDSLRGLTQAADMTLITATHKKLVDCCHVDVARSPFPNIFNVRQLGCFDQEELDQFLEQTSTESGLDLTPYADEVRALSGGHPYLLQMACWHYYEAIAHGGEADHKAIAEAFTHEAEADFGRMWEGLSDRERETLADLTQGKGRGATDDGLRTKGYVNEDGAIFSPAFREYVKRLI